MLFCATAAQVAKQVLFTYNIDMTIRLRTAFFIFLALLILWFVYIDRAILTPFILAALFAYIVNPIVNFFSHKMKIPRTVSILIIYTCIIGAITFALLSLTSKVIQESSELGSTIQHVIDEAKIGVRQLPDWMQPTIAEMLVSLEKSRIFSANSLFALFPEAISKIVSLLIFLFSGFYFLKEGGRMLDKLLTVVPNDYRVEVEILIRRINSVLGGYLRGQIFLIILISMLFFITLSIFGARFALVLAIFSGLAEVVPIFGPIIATTVTSIVVYLTGVSGFGLTPLQGAIAVAVIYIIIRQFQDYFITPFVMARITKLHPFVIFFAVTTGGHLMGILGFILAVPVAATIRILFEYLLDKVNTRYVSK